MTTREWFRVMRAADMERDFIGAVDVFEMATDLVQGNNLMPPVIYDASADYDALWAAVTGPGAVVFRDLPGFYSPLYVNQCAVDAGNAVARIVGCGIERRRLYLCDRAGIFWFFLVDCDPGDEDERTCHMMRFNERAIDADIERDLDSLQSHLGRVIWPDRRRDFLAFTDRMTARTGLDLELEPEDSYRGGPVS